MGTASLVIGLALIIVGFYYIFEFLSSRYQEGEAIAGFIGMLVISVPLISVGGLLLRKYDRDKKKSKIS